MQSLIVLGRREPEPLELEGIGKTLAGALASLAGADGIKDLLTRDDSDVS